MSGAQNAELGEQIYKELLATVRRDTPASPAAEAAFAEDIRGLSIESVFGAVWGRPGLDRRSRSLVTLGILIALRAEGELRLHFQIARANGLSLEELEEVVYQAAAYAGFPAASAARHVGRAVFDS